MTSLILGFYLGKEETDENDCDFYRFACFFPLTKAPRLVVKLRSCNGPLVARVGEIIKLVPSADKLIEKAWCSFQKLEEMFYIHEDVASGMVHTHKSVEIGECDSTANGIYNHPELGEMLDQKHLCVPGTYHSITFRVVPADTTFQIEVLQAVRGQGALKESGRFSIMGKVLQKEKDTIQLAENQSWNAFGNLKLVMFDHQSFFAGSRPVFELVDARFTELFQKRIAHGGKILMFKQVENEKGEWEDEKDDNELRGCAFAVADHKNMCVVKMANRCERLDVLEMKLGDMYRFESDIRIDEVMFWETKQHKENELFKHSEEGEKDLDMLKVLDTHMIEGDAPFKDARVSCDWLNAVQREALEMARNEERKLVCIQGPPGTGKSFVLATYIVSLLKDGKSAVVMTPTKEALFNLKNITMGLVEKRGIDIHADALMDTWTFESRIEETQAAREGKEQLKKWRRSWEKKELSDEDYAKLQRTLINGTKASVMKEIAPNVKVVYATISSKFTQAMMSTKQFHPCVCIIDEASQVMEAQQWPACVEMQRIVMAGDPHQLPAIVFSEEGKMFSLQSSVMDRIMAKKEQFSWIMLETQYRCHEEIISWSNKTFYKDNLKHATDKKTLKDFITKNPPPSKIARIYDPMVMFDTSMINQENPFVVKTYEQIVEKDSDVTYANQGEAEIVIDHLKHIVNMGIDKNTIAIITPYRGQLELLQNMLKEQNLENIQIGTVDAYQGQEFDVVIFSMVRSNPALHLGFVADLRRLNVAITRAKYHFCFVGNAFMLHKQGQVRKELKNLLCAFTDSAHRFHPCFAKQKFKPLKKNDIPKINNFGKDFNAFMASTRDPTMISYIQKWQGKQGAKK